MLSTARGVRPLGPPDLDEFLALTAQDPVVNVFADYRARATRIDRRWLAGEVWGYFVRARMVAAVHIGANLVPIEVDDEAIAAFLDFGLARRRRAATIVGPSASVEPLWEQLEPTWGPARDVRRGQPHMELAGPPAIEPDPAVRRTTVADLDAVYPACVAMYTEEVGLSPEEGGGGRLYRARVSQLIERGWQFARIEDGEVLFKAEVACASPHAAQVQGVYVPPDRRGEGLAARGMAAVAQFVHAEIAPVASLYVNEFNQPARRAYARAGFAETASFTTIMF